MRIHENNEGVPVALPVAMRSEQDWRGEAAIGLFFLHVPFPVDRLSGLKPLDDRQTYRRSKRLVAALTFSVEKVGTTVMIVLREWIKSGIMRGIRRGSSRMINGATVGAPTSQPIR